MTGRIEIPQSWPDTFTQCLFRVQLHLYSFIRLGDVEGQSDKQTIEKNAVSFFLIRVICDPRPRITIINRRDITISE